MCPCPAALWSPQAAASPLSAACRTAHAGLGCATATPPLAGFAARSGAEAGCEQGAPSSQLQLSAPPTFLPPSPKPYPDSSRMRRPASRQFPCGPSARGWLCPATQNAARCGSRTTRLACAAPRPRFRHSSVAVNEIKPQDLGGATHFREGSSTTQNPFHLSCPRLSWRGRGVFAAAFTRAWF